MCVMGLSAECCGAIGDDGHVPEKIPLASGPLTARSLSNDRVGLSLIARIRVRRKSALLACETHVRVAEKIAAVDELVPKRALPSVFL